MEEIRGELKGVFILFKLTSLPTHQGVPGEETGGRVVAVVVAGGVHDSVDTHTRTRTMRMLITVNFNDVAALHRGRGRAYSCDCRRQLLEMVSLKCVCIVSSVRSFDEDLGSAPHTHHESRQKCLGLLQI